MNNNLQFYRVLFTLMVSFSYLLSPSARAHVKWLQDAEQVTTMAPFTVLEVSFATFFLSLGLGIAFGLQRYLKNHYSTLSNRFSDSVIPLRIAHGLLALYFMGCALSGHLLVPHLHLPSYLQGGVMASQIIISACLFLNYAKKFTAMLIAILFFMASILDPVFFIEYFFLAALALLIYARRQLPHPKLMTCLRLALGISFITLGLTEKLLQPALALNVLKQYPLNFMLYLGLNFPDSWFVLAAGTVELFIGILFLGNIMVRTTMVVLLCLMVASNTYFFAVGNYSLAILELIGHLPVFAVGVLVVFYSGWLTQPAAALYIKRRDETLTKAGYSLE